VIEGSQGPSAPCKGSGGTVATTRPFGGVAPLTDSLTGVAGVGVDVDGGASARVDGEFSRNENLAEECFGIGGRGFGNTGPFAPILVAFLAYIGGSSYLIFFRFVGRPSELEGRLTTSDFTGREGAAEVSRDGVCRTKGELLVCIA
jgi:hypothetical protein